MLHTVPCATIPMRSHPASARMPGMATANGRAIMPFGVMGGSYRPVGYVHVPSNLLDFGMDPQEAIDAPRVYHNGKLAVRIAELELMLMTSRWPCGAIAGRSTLRH